MSVKHTKGNWSYHERYRETAVITDISDDDVCTINQGFTFGYEDGKKIKISKSQDELLATAKLMASAPDLLYQLQRTLKTLEELTDETKKRNLNEIFVRITNIERVIKKATE